MAKTPTIHNPTHFEPSHYEVVDYLDNKRPVYFGQGIEAFNAEVEDWKAQMTATFGADYAKKIHRCVHCGNGNVRWITATFHEPTGETVVFGSDCTARLGFRNKVQFKLAQIQAKAEAGHARMKVWKARVAFLEANPAIAEAIEQAKNPIHAKNFFVQDVLSKLNQYGSLSVRQVEAVLKSLKRDVETAAAKAVEVTEVKGNAPEGRQTVTGVVLSTKLVEGFYGNTLKALLKLENNSKVWLTVPSKSSFGRGDTVTVTASFEVSKDDPFFAFGKRPVVVKVVTAEGVPA
jgi:vacuolar-type H+-ATPase subunit E/Vma4